MKTKTILMKRSSAEDQMTKYPKMPNATSLEYGELAVNYAVGRETISLRNSDNGLATFTNEVLISPSGTPSYPDSTLAKIIIDESVDPVTVDVYTQEQVDGKVDALNQKDTDLQNAIDDKVLRGSEAAPAQTAILIDETESPEYLVYTRAEVDSMFAKLKADNHLA